MFFTSAKLAINNLTLVEDINRLGKIHRLAILKPSPQRLAEISITSASTASYSEITYPLDIPPPLEGTRVSRPYVKTIRHDRLSEPILLEDARRMVGLTGVPNSTAIESVHENSHFRDSRSESLEAAIVDNSSITFSATPNIETSTTDELQPPVGNPAQLNTNRDLKAVRTFAILETISPGDNPWDLGSPLLNWKTVMGDHFIDWFLPIKRSPCCNHDNTESHFAIGPTVDHIRASVGFISPSEVRPEGHRRRKMPENAKEDQANQSGRRFSPIDEEAGRETDKTELRDLRTRNSRK